MHRCKGNCDCFWNYWFAVKKLTLASIIHILCIYECIYLTSKEISMKLFTKSALEKKYPLVTGEDSPILRITCDVVKHITPDIKQFCKDIAKLMWKYEWVWLAAPQIGQNYRIAAISQWDTSSKDDQWRTAWKLTDEFVIINPEILVQSDEQEIEEEACLSLPKIKWDVSRPVSITLQYLGVDNKIHIHKATWFNARVILHEMDHLDGVLFIDKLA